MNVNCFGSLPQCECRVIFDRQATLRKLFRVVEHIQKRPFKNGFDQVDALSAVNRCAEQVIGGYYKLQHWMDTNL